MLISNTNTKELFLSKPPRRGYIVDSGWYSGGGEAMYQLAMDLSNMGYEIHIAYLNEMSSYLPPKRFKKYVRNVASVIPLDQVPDSEETFIVVPESYTSVLLQFYNIRPYIWWLSYNYYDGLFVPDYFGTGPFRQSKEFLKIIQFQNSMLFNKYRFGFKRYPIENAINLSGSFFVTQKLQELGIPSLKLIHSISADFLKAGMHKPENDMELRGNSVLFNPSKPSRLMQKLLKRNSFHYIPLKGLTFQELRSLFISSKLYVDFGVFPGPERLPKETVYNGMNILVGKRNAAATEDVLIPEKYKIDINSKPESVELKIQQMLDDYYKIYHDFDSFRMYISQMESEYYQQLQSIFGVKQIQTTSALTNNIE